MPEQDLSFHYMRYYHISGDDNPADMLTKFLPHHKWWSLMKPFLHWIDLDENGNPQDEANGEVCQQEQHKECDGTGGS